MDKVAIKSDEPMGPQIMLAFVRNHKTGKCDKVRMISLIPGMVINRCGKKYTVDAKGIQRRVE